MKEGIFVGHSSLALPPLDLALLELYSLALAPLALTPLAFAPLCSPLPLPLRAKTAKRGLKWQKAS